MWYPSGHLHFWIKPRVFKCSGHWLAKSRSSNLRCATGASKWETSSGILGISQNYIDNHWLQVELPNLSKSDDHQLKCIWKEPLLWETFLMSGPGAHSGTYDFISGTWMHLVFAIFATWPRSATHCCTPSLTVKSSCHLNVLDSSRNKIKQTIIYIYIWLYIHIIDYEEMNPFWFSKNTEENQSMNKNIACMHAYTCKHTNCAPATHIFLP